MEGNAPGHFWWSGVFLSDETGFIGLFFLVVFGGFWVSIVLASGGSLGISSEPAAESLAMEGVDRPPTQIGAP
jgi:hypothetical protein